MPEIVFVELPPFKLPRFMQESMPEAPEEAFETEAEEAEYLDKAQDANA